MKMVLLCISETETFFESVAEGSKLMDEQAVRQEMELRLDLARLFRSARAGSKYAKNLSAAARAAKITPSYLHRIEGAETLASADCYVGLCELYSIETAPILHKLGRIDSHLEARVVDCIETHYELLDFVLSLTAEQVSVVQGALEGVPCYGRQETNTARKTTEFAQS